MAVNWSELSQRSLDEILVWANDQPSCRAMADCQQDPQWHAEGDVWTHTKMVCAQLPKLADWPDLSSHDRTVLIFTALFHDAGKALTSQVDPVTGRTVSPKHAIKGEFIARSVLRGLSCDLQTREEIGRMVRYHGRPVFLLEKPEPSHEVVSLSWLVNNRLLYSFALADTRGRSTREMGRPEENLHLWKLMAEEHDCFDRPYAFPNDHARFLFFRQQTPSLHYVPHEDFPMTVTMMSGLPGSGKDTWLRNHRPELPVVSLDSLREELETEPTDNQGEVAQLARERCRELLRSKTSFAFNATNLQKPMRKRWIDLFADYGARIEIVYLEPDYNVILQQNQRRDRPVPKAVIHGLAERCEPPTWAEAHQLITGASSTR